jgi:hypothetical protein
MRAPSGDAALAHAHSASLYLDNAAAAADMDDLSRAAYELANAKSQFLNVEHAATNTSQPILVAQEVVIARQYRPGHGFAFLDATNVDESANVTQLAITKGWKMKPLSLKDYSISFGDLNVQTDLAVGHLDLGIAAAREGNKDRIAAEIAAARSAIVVEFNGDDVE